MSEYKPVSIALPTGLALEVLPHGLTLHKVIVQAHGRPHDIVIGPEAPEDHATQKYTNSIIGRYTNRIPVGTHVLERNGIKSEITTLANESARVSLHGGPKGFDAVPWSLLTPETPATLFTAAELAHFAQSSAHAIFRLVSPDRDQGYPGKLVVEALVALIAPEERNVETPQPETNVGSIVLVFRAKLDEGDKGLVTPVNLTQHWGFNLDASLRETGEPASVKGHKLTLKSDRFAKFDADGLYAGFLMASDYPEHNHASGKLIGSLAPQRGYDNFYFLRNAGARHIPTRISLSTLSQNFDLVKDIMQPMTEYGRGSRPEAVAELASEKSGINLAFDTNQHGVMLYTNYLASSDKGARKKIHGGSGISGHGDSYGSGTAAFLEFHQPLAAFLDPLNKDREDTLLTTHELYHNYIRCDISVKATMGNLA